MQSALGHAPPNAFQALAQSILGVASVERWWMLFEQVNFVECHALLDENQALLGPPTESTTPSPRGRALRPAHAPARSRAAVNAPRSPRAVGPRARWRTGG